MMGNQGVKPLDLNDYTSLRWCSMYRLSKKRVARVESSKIFTIFYFIPPRTLVQVGSWLGVNGMEEEK